MSPLDQVCNRLIEYVPTNELQEAETLLRDLVTDATGFITPEEAFRITIFLWE